MPKLFRFEIATMIVLGLFLGDSTSYAQQPSLSSGKTLKYNKKFPPPAPLYSDLLSRFQSQPIWKTGNFTAVDRIRAVFLPEYDDPKHAFEYNTATGARLAHQLKTKGGKIVDTHFYHGKKHKRPFWSMHPTNSNDFQLEAGDHVVEFFLEGKIFYKFPFKVRVKGGADAYNPDNRYYLDGPWSQYVYFYVANNNLNNTPEFSIWLRDEKAKPGAWGKPNMNVTFRRGKTLVAAWPGPGQANPLQLKPWYTRYDVTPRTKKGMVKAKEYMKNGSYSVTVKLNNKVHSRYRYRVKGGKFVYQDRQNRKKTNPLMFIEGGGQRYFLKRR